MAFVKPRFLPQFLFWQGRKETPALQRQAGPRGSSLPYSSGMVIRNASLFFLESLQTFVSTVITYISSQY